MATVDIIAPLDPTSDLPIVRAIGPADLWYALAKGFDDFKSMPTQVVFLCLIYPVIGLTLGRLSFGYEVVPLLYPLATGFALLGPFAAIGLYELSRRREQALETSWRHAFDVLYSPSLRSILAVGGLLLVIFAFWLMIAQTIYVATFGDGVPTSPTAFVRDVLTTRSGHMLIVLGNLAGFTFAVLAFSLSVVSLPLLLDRNVGAAVAIATSIRAVAVNPVTMALWGLIVAVALAIGTALLFIGLAIVFPVLGHATWHLYRRVVVADPSPRPVLIARPKVERFAADFPAVLFTLFKRSGKP